MSSLSSTLGSKLTTEKGNVFLALKISAKNIWELHASCVTNTSVFSEMIPDWFTSDLGKRQFSEDQ